MWSCLTWIVAPYLVYASLYNICHVYSADVTSSGGGEVPMSTMLNELVARLQRNVVDGQPDRDEQPMRVPASAYADPDQYRREIDRIFLNSPVMVALVAELRDAGD